MIVYLKGIRNPTVSSPQNSMSDCQECPCDRACGWTGLKTGDQVGGWESCQLGEKQEKRGEVIAILLILEDFFKRFLDLGTIQFQNHFVFQDDCKVSKNLRIGFRAFREGIFYG